MKKKIATFSLQAKVIEALREEAERQSILADERVSMSAIIERLIKKHILKKAKKAKK